MRPTTDEERPRLAGPAVPGPSHGQAVVGLLKASHPMPATAVTVLAALLAAACGLDLVSSAVAVAAVAAGQLSIGWCNDRLDVRRDRAAGRRDKPLATGAARPDTVGTAAGAALLVCVPLSLGCGLPAGAVHLAGVAAGWTYNLWLKRTVLSWLPYAVAFGLLPAFLTLSLPGRPWPPLWLTAAAALLGTGAHFANVLPDIEDDLAGGVRGLPQRLGRRGATATAVLLALASCVLLTAGPTGRVSPAGAGLVGVTLALGAVALAGPPGLLRGRVPFAAVVAMAGLDAALLVLSGGALTGGRTWP
ncbi:UbiA family prenyltransferase [Streptomyces roseicoloratus]|uniref:UbiA family prenyltransferase n=1 Tax=Streptomyces roseicoloratus TaxID=2508722 RepID=A0ABY9RQI8_9ACTN|nr:UbiA family prenyltransferase [Streptomyces roseicoloratus]WMX43726.1 UbiA family prenyltransferase [Streptomyces roseicoloratus]